MTLWLVRAGGEGEFEHRFLEEERIYLTWEQLIDDLTKLKTKEAVGEVLRRSSPDAGGGKLRNHLNQIWAFREHMATGDWFALPSKFARTIHFGEITGPCQFDTAASPPYKHFRTCKWIARDVPRDRFDEDILYSLGAFLTICRIKRNDAEARIRAVAANDWQPVAIGSVRVKQGKGNGDDPSDAAPSAAETGSVDLEELARDSIARLIVAKFKGHGLARIVEAILRAEGYATHRSPEGPDYGIDILAGTGPMGFGSPRICTQVKSGDASTDRPEVDQLLGSMQHAGAEHGLFVSWGGFKSTVKRELGAKFFKLRLWDQKELIEQVLAHYDRLDEEIRAELPLKRIWTIAGSEDERT